MGGGVFTEKSTSINGVVFGDIVLADIDNDNDLDLCIAGAYSGTTGLTQIYYNDGTGYFTSGQTLTPTKDGNIAFADLDGDGHLDLVYTGERSSITDYVLEVYKNDGTDVTAPVADAATLADITSECEITTLTEPTATDNCSGTVVVTHDATLPITASTTVTWTYDDGNGNTSTQTQNIVIEDVTAPVADAATLADITSECEITTLTEPTATDNCSGTVVVTHDATLPITASTTVTWTYDDGNGNTSTQTQNIVIEDVTAPVADAATLADITSECEITTLTEPTATDNCSGTVVVTHDATLPITASTTVTWTYDD
ncbi:FG-GAP repeat protein, partial [Ancylostoma ceylanicum]